VTTPKRPLAKHSIAKRAAVKSRIPAGMPGPGSAVAIIPVRDGQLPLGGADVCWEVGQAGLALLMGSGVAAAAATLPAELRVWGWENGDFAPGGWAQQLAPLVKSAGRIILPASPDGRDLAPRIAAALNRPLVAGVAEIRRDPRDSSIEIALVPRWDGAALAEVALSPDAVITRLPSSSLPAPAGGGAIFRELSFPLAPVTADVHDAQVTAVLPADPATIDLSEARRIIAGGAGLGGPEAFVELAAIAEALAASLGATRLVADLGWVDPARYIGTTGVSVDPDLYIALGISGAVQHMTGLGDPRHIVSVNTDPSCPMMARAELALVCDARELLAALAARLEVHANV
jgi:electron transfer flavoprotein alpha subunit